MMIRGNLRWVTAAILMMLAASATAAERTVTLAVENMTCASCPYIVEKSLERGDGVVDATVSFEERRASVRFDDARTSVDALTRATKEAGYPSRVVE